MILRPVFSAAWRIILSVPYFTGLVMIPATELPGDSSPDPFSPLFYGISDDTIVGDNGRLDIVLNFQSPILRD